MESRETGTGHRKHTETIAEYTSKQVSLTQDRGTQAGIMTNAHTHTQVFLYS